MNKIEKLLELGFTEQEISEMNVEEVPDTILLIDSNQEITDQDVKEAEALLEELRTYFNTEPNFRANLFEYE